MWRHVAVIVACIEATAAVAAQPSTPYKAYVVVEEAYVRSGPGEGFYPTEKVRFGRELEVYQRDAAGWCAIRPLEESFSWVPAWDIRLGEDGLAEVATDNVAARVGSQFSDVRDVVQVRLKRGELLEVLGWKRMGTGETAQTWYRVSPPSGEFRWIHERFLDVHPPQARIVRAAADPPAVASEPGGVRQAVAVQPAQGPANSAPAASRPAIATGQWVQGASHPPAAAPAQATSATAAPSSSAGSPAGPSAVSREEFQAELDDINTELSLMLAEEPSAWNCEELIRRTEALLSASQTSSERAHARLLLNRLARAAQVKKRFDAVYRAAATTPPMPDRQAVVQALRNETSGPAPPAVTAAADGPASPALLPPHPAAPLPAEGSGRGQGLYDAMGRLTRVMPGKLGGPRYALLDERGRVTCYVTPAPGVGLQHYVGRRVGITGNRDPFNDLNAPHVTARHVAPLDGAYRR